MDEKNTATTINNDAEKENQANSQSKNSEVSLTLNKYLGGIKDHIGTLTFFATVCTAIFGAVIRFGFYIYDCGVMFKWELPIKAIDISSNNLIYQFIMYALIILPILLFIAGTYKLLIKLYEKAKWGFIATIIIYIAIFVTLVVFLRYSIASSTVRMVFLICYLLITLIYFPAFSMCVGDILGDWYNKKKEKTKGNKDKKEENKNTTKDFTEEENNEQLLIKDFLRKIKVMSFTFIIAASLIGTVIFLWSVGEQAQREIYRVVDTEQTLNLEPNMEKEEANTKSDAETDQHEEIIPTTYMIIYETEDSYYLCSCIVKDGIIVDYDSSIKKVISKDNIYYREYKILLDNKN